jgi:enoyl-CoA hydratase/carnithine racemase
VVGRPPAVFVDRAAPAARRYPVEFVRLEVEDGVGTIRVDRPKMNPLDRQTQQEIAAAAQEAGERADVRAVVIWGGERTFAAGADIKEMAQMSHRDMVVASRGL